MRNLLAFLIACAVAAEVKSETQTLVLADGTRLSELAWVIQAWPSVAETIRDHTGCNLDQLDVERLVSFEEYRAKKEGLVARYRKSSHDRFFMVVLKGECMPDEAGLGSGWLVRYSGGAFAIVEVSFGIEE